MSAIKLMLAELRKERGVTQSELANYLGVSFQSVSQWEKGVTFPDINLLPKLAVYFQVSVDEILGLKPRCNREYLSRGTNSSEHWDQKLDYLKSARVGFWNDDYLEFLVNQVWKITKPVNIIDFGCGYGYLGMILLPLLPKGSIYTGVDISETLISEAKSHFKDSEYQTQFMVRDLNSFQESEKYDIAICQALLRHLPNPKEILKKMVDAVSVGGMVICIEVNREFENTGFAIQGMDYNVSERTSAFQKLWQTELANEGRDYAVGMKVPFYMQECGLHHIGVRLNDKVNFMNSNGNQVEYEKSFNSLLDANGWNRTLAEDEKEDAIAFLMNRGVTRAEAEAYLKSNQEMGQYLMKNKGNVCILKTLCLLISYGIK